MSWELGRVLRCPDPSPGKNWYLCECCEGCSDITSGTAWSPQPHTFTPAQRDNFSLYLGPKFVSLLFINDSHWLLKYLLCSFGKKVWAAWLWGNSPCGCRNDSHCRNISYTAPENCWTQTLFPRSIKFMCACAVLEGGLIARYDCTRSCVQIRAAAGTRGIFHRLVVTCHAAPSSVNC